MITTVFNKVRVTKRLLEMDEKIRFNTYRRVLRKASKPMVDELRQAWTGAKRKRGEVSKAISKAQTIQIKMYKRGKRAGSCVLKVGTNYKRGGLVKVWHILEGGFKHFGKGAKTYGISGEALAVRARQKQHAAQFATPDFKSMSKIQQRQFFKARADDYNARNPSDRGAEAKNYHERNANKKAAREGKSVAIRGRFISAPIAKRYQTLLAQRAQKLLVDEVMAPVRGSK